MTQTPWPASLREPEAPWEIPAVPGWPAVLDAMELGALIVDTSGPELSLLYANPAYFRVTGLDPEDSPEAQARWLQDTSDAAPALQEVRAALAETRACRVELRGPRAEADESWLSLSLSPLPDATRPGTRVRYFLGLLRDITQQRRQQQEHATAQGLYRILLAEEELVLAGGDLGDMLQQACERLADAGLFRAALIARAGQHGHIDLLAQAGATHIGEDWYRPNVLGEHGERSLAARAWNLRRLQYSNDYLSEPALSQYREHVRRAGIASVAMVPVLRGGHRWALLGVAAAQVGAFTPAVLELLERVARLLGHALDAFDLRRRLQQEHHHISWLAEHDALTGLLNRRGLRLRLQDLLAQTDAQGGFVAVGILDFDDFKQLNDNHGHAAGDALLRTVAARLVEAVRSSDMVARLGGDEIVLVMQGLVAREDLEPVLERIRDCIAEPVTLPPGDSMLQVRASLGLTVYPDDASEPDELLRHADQALYAIKRQPRGSGAPFWRLYQPEVDRDQYQHMRLVRERFDAGGLRVHYQPVVDMASWRVVEVEALARLDDGQGRLIGPLDFIHQLGRDGLVAMTVAVLRQAAADAQRWQRELGVELSIAVNIDPLLLASGEALDTVRDVATSSGLAPQRMVLELLEHNDFLSFASAQDTLAELRAFGCRIALDDVGSAYSSLLRVKELPIDIIKLDQGFIRGLADNPQDLRFVQSLAQLARGLGVDFVAEGAETPDIVDALRALRVPQAQGWGIARPMPAEAFGAWLAAWRPRRRDTLQTGLLSCVAQQLVALDTDLLIARHYPEPKPPLIMSGDPVEGPLGRWLRGVGLSPEHPLSLAYAELYAMFHDWMAAGPDADDAMTQSALDHLLRCAGDYLRAQR